MDNRKTNLPVVAGIEIPVDSEGRYNLNALHKASGEGVNKAPAQWLRTKQAQEFIQEIIDVQICTSPVSASKGGSDQGTFAHELIAVEYAGWINAGFRIKVNQTFIDYRTGKLDAPSRRSSVTSQFQVKMALARAAKSMLRMSETSTIRMLTEIAKSEGVEPTFLPIYVNESLTKALTPMLTDLGHHLAKKVRSIVYPALAAMGIMEQITRKSTSSPDGIKKFWSLTPAGLQYGRNETSTNNPRQTQPLFFVDQFPALLERLEAHLDASPPPVDIKLPPETSHV